MLKKNKVNNINLEKTVVVFNKHKNPPYPLI